MTEDIPAPEVPDSTGICHCTVFAYSKHSACFLPIRNLYENKGGLCPKEKNNDLIVYNIIKGHNFKSNKSDTTKVCTWSKVCDKMNWE